MALHCHHFLCQNVLPVEDEPTYVCCADKEVFVATACCHIEQYRVDAGQCAFIGRFPTVGVVHQMAYCVAGDFLVTIESATTKRYRTFDGEQLTTRVYINLGTADLEHEPMKARVAGQLASLRWKSISLNCVDNLHRFSVIEIPLKDTPRHVAANGQTRNIAVSMAPRYNAGSMQCRILIYGLCCKRIARSQLVYRDIKCLMELDFAFEIQQISMCEEFLICSSAHECQLIQMNFDNNREKSSSRPSSSFFMRSPAVSGDQSCIPDLACGEGKRDSLISSNSSSALLSSDTLGSLNLDCSTKNEDDDEIMRLLMTCSADTEATTKKSFQKTMYADGDLLIGPVKGSTRPCPVNVEFEDTCGCGDSPSGVLDNGVTTWLYRKLYGLSRQSGGIVSIQLLPVYIDKKEMSTSTSSRHKRRNSFVSSKRGLLCGLFCFISSPLTGQLFSILDGAKLVATYNYTSEITQAMMTADRLFVMSATNIDVYSCHCLSYLAKMTTDENGNNFLHENHQRFEPSHLGTNRFVCLNKMHATKDFVTLMSKAMDNKDLESSWSVYVLICPTAEDFRADMMQLAATYEDTDEKAHEILVSEAQMLGTGASFFKRISRSNVDDELQQQQQSGQDDVNFCVDHRLPADMSYDTTVDSVSTSAMGNRIRFISCLDDTRISNGHVVSANDEQATVGDCGVDCSTTQRASNAVEFFAGAADSGVEAVCTENGPVADGVEQTVVIENSAVEHVTSDSIIRHELVSDVFPEVCSSRRGSGDRNKDDVDDGDGCRLAVAEDGVMSDVATTTMPHEAESGVIIIRTQAMDDDEGQGHACHGMTMDGDEAANDSSSITRCSSSDGLVDRSTTPVDGDGDADLSINGDDCCHTGSVGQFPHPAAEPPSSDDRLCGAEHDLCIVDKFPDGFDAAACASDVLVNEPCR